MVAGHKQFLQGGEQNSNNNGLQFSVRGLSILDITDFYSLHCHHDEESCMHTNTIYSTRLLRENVFLVNLVSM